MTEVAVFVDENGFHSGFQIASPKQIAATRAMPAIAMTMSFLKSISVLKLRAVARVPGYRFVALSRVVGGVYNARQSTRSQPTTRAQRGVIDAPDPREYSPRL
jgi:hypothetical protein